MDLARTNGTIVASHCGPETSEHMGKLSFSFFFFKSFKPHLHKYTKTWCNFGSHSSCQLHLGSLGFLQLSRNTRCPGWSAIVADPVAEVWHWNCGTLVEMAGLMDQASKKRRRRAITSQNLYHDIATTVKSEIDM